MSVRACCIQIAHVDCQINSWKSIVFFWDYVHGINALCSDTIFLFFFVFNIFGHTNLIHINNSFFGDGLLIFADRFLLLAPPPQGKKSRQKILSVGCWMNNHLLLCSVMLKHCRFLPVQRLIPRPSGNESEVVHCIYSVYGLKKFPFWLVCLFFFLKQIYKISENSAKSVLICQTNSPKPKDIQFTVIKMVKMEKSRKSLHLRARNLVTVQQMQINFQSICRLILDGTVQ